MPFGALTLGLGLTRQGSGEPPTPAAPTINSVTISPDGGPVGTLFTAVVDWTGYPRTGVSYQWQDGGVDIEGETGSTYLSDTEIAVLTVEVDIDNGVGTDSAESAGVEVTAAAEGVFEVGVFEAGVFV